MTPSEYKDYTDYYARKCKPKGILSAYYNIAKDFYLNDKYDVFTAGMFSADMDEHVRIQASRIIPPNLVDGGKYLDAGCGVGKFLKYVADMHPKSNFLGVNVSPMQIAEAVKRKHTGKNIEYQEASYDELDFIEDDSLDGAYFLQSIGYRPLVDTFVGLKRTMKRGSWLSIVDMSQIDDPDTNGAYEIKQIQDAWHYMLFPLDYQIEVARRHGFQPVVVNRNLNMFLDYQPWEDMLVNGLKDFHEHTPLAPIKVTEVVYRKE